MPTRFCCEPGGCWPYGGCFCPIPVCSPCCCPCLPCPCPPIPPVDPPDFSIVLYKRDRITKAPLEGAEYLLKQGDRIWSSRSDASGRLSFDVGEPGNYRLLETQAPAGYQTQSGFYVLTVRPNGNVLLNGAPIPEDSLYDLPLGRLAFLKYDVQTGLPLMNAQFQLSDGKTARSDANGLVDFGVLSPGTYTLEETAPPQGYLPNKRIYIVTVDAAQNIDIDGVSLSNFAIRNQKLPDLAFQKTDVQTGQPLAGARFQLSDGTLATADSNGWVNFGVLPPGNYAFTELDAPKGFLSSKNQAKI